MAVEITGIHHITAVSGDAQTTVDFYTQLLGLRLIKRTVNFDDPGTHHLYVADATGTPGTVLTFFPWGSQASRGRVGTGQVRTTAFSVSEGAMGFWVERLRAHGLEVRGPFPRFEEDVLAFADPDGLELEIVAHAGDARAGWETPAIGAAEAIRGFHSATLSLEGYERTAALLVDTMGFRRRAEAGARVRFEAGAGGPGATVDLLCEPDGPRGTMGAGTIHHIAWRTPSEASQLEVREALAAAGQNVTPVLDRSYFRSIYFREPGRVLFEVATDGPGFTIDEPVAELGTALRVPPWLEDARAEIERRLSPLSVPPHNNP